MAEQGEIGGHLQKAMHHLNKAMASHKKHGKKHKGGHKARGHKKARGHEVPRGIGHY